MPKLLLVAILLALPPSLPKPRLSCSESEALALHELFEQEWESDLKESPTLASLLGDRRYNHRWPDMSLAAIERRHRHYGKVLEGLARMDFSNFSARDRLNAELFRRLYRERVEEHRYRWFLLPVDHRGGLPVAHELAELLPFDSAKDYKDWIRRLKSIGRYVDDHIELMRKGMEVGMIHPRVILERVRSQIAAQIVDDPTESPFYWPFESIPDEIRRARKHRLRTAAKLAIRRHVVPAYRRLRKFFEEEYLPAGRESVGIWDLPCGRELYGLRVRRFTTTELTPRQIHEIGLREIRRIRKEMKAAIREVGFRGSFAEFLDYLRSDPRFYFTKPEDLLKEYRATAQQIAPGLLRLFGKLPRMPFAIRPIPTEVAPHTSTAYYNGPALEGRRPGILFVNLSRLQARPKYEIEALTAHGTVPGHHLQIALSMELGDLPKFRRVGGGYTAFVEGWAFYAESLGPELGLYRDPYSRFGQLTYEMWRAVRLVVDTGLHAFHWSRDRALAFFQDNAAKTEHDITNEIDRYIAWPGQAVAYKIGELKIKELRRRAEGTLGRGFDIRRFHDVILGQGALPLDILERNVNAFIAETKQRESSRQKGPGCVH